MYSTLEKLKPELKRAVNLIRLGARPTFMIKVCNDFKEFEQIKSGSMSSCRIGEMNGRSFQLGTNYVNTLVTKAMQKHQWPESVKYSNGVLFIESITEKSEDVFDIENGILGVEYPLVLKPKKWDQLTKTTEDND